MAGGLHYKLGLDTGGFTGPLGMAKSALGGFLGIASKVGNITTGLASAKTLIGDVVGILNQPIGMAADMEALNMSFRSLLKDGGKAKALVGDLMQFADKTPFEPGPVAEAGKQLLAFGVAADGIIPLLTDVGDLAAAMDKPLDQVADTFGRLKAGQFGEAFERLRAFGISMKDLEGGGLQFDKNGSFQGTAEQAMEGVRQIIRRKFGGGMADLSGTFKGLFSTLSGYWNQMKAKFGEPIMKSVKPLLEEATGLIKAWTPEAVKFGETIGTAISGIRNLYKSGELGTAISAALAGGGQMLGANLKTGIAAAVQLLGVGLKTAFTSGVALLSDANFWSGIRMSVLAITDDVKASLLNLAADLVDKLPPALRLGADTEGMRKSAAEAADWGVATRTLATEAFAQVDWGAVMKPVEDGTLQGGKILTDAFAQVRDSIVNNTSLREAGRMLTDASKRDSATPQGLRDLLTEASRARGDMFLAGGKPGQGFIPTADGGRGYAQLPLNTARLDQIMNRPDNRQTADNWAEKLVRSSWAQTVLSEIKQLRHAGSEPAGVFL